MAVPPPHPAGTRSTGPGRHAPRPSAYDKLRVVVASLPHAAPEFTADAVTVLRTLARTRDQLATSASMHADRELRDAVAALVTTIGWVLDGWADRVNPTRWTRDQTIELGQDLDRIHQIGRRIGILVDHYTSAPARQDVDTSVEAFPPVPGVPRHRRRRSTAPRWSAAKESPRGLAGSTAANAAEEHSGVAVVVGAGIAMLALAAGWFAMYDTRDPAAHDVGAAELSPPAKPPASAHTADSAASGGTRPSAAAASTPMPVPASAAVTSIQMLPLGSSAQVERIEVEFLIDVSDNAGFALRISWGRADQAPVSAETRELFGTTSYDFAVPIDVTPALCDGPVVITASAGTVSATTTTMAGPCAATADTSPAGTKEPE